MKKIIYILGFIALGLIISCEHDTESIQLSDTITSFDMTGQWNVTAHNDSVQLFGPFKVITRLDSSTGNDSITIQDAGTKFWEFQTKALVNEENGTFETRLSICEICEDGIGVKISNGKILNSDSIYFEIQFEDDETPYGNTYRIQGHRIKG